MKLYKFSPIDLSDISWERSWHQDEAIIRAENEQQARKLAMRLHDHGFDHQEQTVLNPWANPSFAHCEEIPFGHYPTDGPAQILVPEIPPEE